MAISGTGTWSYSFDAANRLTSTTNPASETTSFTLDNAGRCTRQDNGNTTYAHCLDCAHRYEIEDRAATSHRVYRRYEMRATRRCDAAQRTGFD